MQENDNSQIIKTIGEHGEEIFMKLQEIVSVDDKDYALLSVVEENTLPLDDNAQDDELIIMRMVKTDNECTFEMLEDEEFQNVVKAISDDESDEEFDEE